MKNKMMIPALAGLLSAALVMDAEAMGAKEGFEKCAGIVKQGMNDCAANAHSCAGQAKMDADKNEWILVPEGTCAKIVNGRVVSK